MPISNQPQAAVPADPRQARIAEAAYYRAERRGFRGGCPIEDWLAAEREIDRQPARSAPAPAPRVALVFLDRDPVQVRSSGANRALPFEPQAGFE
jgi:hypothetical protein